MEIQFSLIVTPQQQDIHGLISDVTIVTCVHTPDKMLSSEITVILSSLSLLFHQQFDPILVLSRGMH